MIFTAKLRRPSAAWSAWHDNHRPGGTLYGVAFQVAPGGNYVTDILEPWAVEALRVHPDVILEMIGTDVPEPEPEMALAERVDDRVEVRDRDELQLAKRREDRDRMSEAVRAAKAKVAENPSV